MIFQEQMTFAEGLQLTVIAMAIVFTLLFAISMILELFKKIPQDKVVTKVTPKPVMAAAIKEVDFSELEADEDMMVAAIVASMEAAGDTKLSNYKITRITKL